MKKREELSTSAMLWWVRRETDDFTMKPYGHDDAFQITVFHRGIRRVFTGNIKEAVKEAYNFIAKDTIQYHKRVREFFAVAIGDVPPEKLKPLANNETPSS